MFRYLLPAHHLNGSILEQVLPELAKLALPRSPTVKPVTIMLNKELFVYIQPIPIILLLLAAPFMLLITNKTDVPMELMMIRQIKNAYLAIHTAICVY